jgi:hypothetical protein
MKNLSLRTLALIVAGLGAAACARRDAGPIVHDDTHELARELSSVTVQHAEAVMADSLAQLSCAPGAANAPAEREHGGAAVADEAVGTTETTGAQMTTGGGTATSGTATDGPPHVRPPLSAAEAAQRGDDRAAPTPAASPVPSWPTTPRAADPTAPADTVR